MAEYKSNYTGEQIDAAIGKANTALQEELEPAFNASASKDITNQDITNWNNKSDFSGSYNDLTNKPTIPSDTSDLTNNAGFITNAVDNLTNYYKKNETYTQNEIDSKLSSVYKYRGTVATYNDLPVTGQIVGDVYNVEDTGDNYAWAGLVWDKLGATIDLTNYVTNTDYATASTGGVIKSGGYGLAVDNNGKIYGFSSDYANYQNVQNTYVISKGTLENVITGKQLVNQTDINGKEDTTNKVSTIDSTSTNTQYAGAKAVWDLISGMSEGANVEMIYSPGNNVSALDVSNLKKGAYFIIGNGNISRNIYVKLPSGNITHILSACIPFIIVFTKDVNEWTDNTSNGVFCYLIGTSYDDGGQFICIGIQCNNSILSQVGNSTTSTYNFKTMVFGEQIFQGIKTFSSLPKAINGGVALIPTQDGELTSKKYVDDSITAQIGNINTILATLTTPQGGNE